MGVRAWALKPGELKPLSRGGLLLLSARCAMRVEPWIPDGAEALWHDGLALVVTSAFGPPMTAKEVAKVVAKKERALSDCGAEACNRLEVTDEPLGRCMNYAMSALAAAVEATGCNERSAALKLVIQAAKLSASIAAVWAHAGRARVAGGQDPVETIATAVWSAIRDDIAHIASLASETALAATADPVRALREIAPLWPGRPPAWASPR